MPKEELQLTKDEFYIVCAEAFDWLQFALDYAPDKESASNVIKALGPLETFCARAPNPLPARLAWVQEK